jgi:hypothetical protein
MGAQAARISERLQKEIAHACKMLVLELVRELKRATPVDTGNARWNWIPSVGVRSTQEADGPDLASLGLERVLAYTLSSGALWVSNVVPYIEALNYGHSAQAPAGFVEAAIDRAISTVRQKLSRRGSFIDLAPLQAQIRDELGGQTAGNLASAYSPFGGD